MSKFINRTKELEQVSQGNILAVMGRRRVGKSTLIDEYIQKFQGVRLQCIESTSHIQLISLWNDLKEHLDLEIEPQTFEDLFKIINANFKNSPKKFIICIDEFPYLFQTDQSIASRFQKWIDSKSFQETQVQIIFCGSSKTIMQMLFERSSGALFDRCDVIIRLKPMQYKHFCEYMRMNPLDLSSFKLFSLVGGIPKYWKQLSSFKIDIEKAMVELFMKEDAFFENEPIRILKDEKIDGISALGVFDAIGRGAHKPSEIAALAGLPFNGLSRLLRYLEETQLIQVKTPFGSNPEKSKNRLYKIIDPALKFWYSVAKVHKHQWQSHKSYTRKFKNDIFKIHVGQVLENLMCDFYKAQSYWERSLVEFDMVRFHPEIKSCIIISEIKSTLLKDIEKKRLLVDLESRIKKSQLIYQYPNYKLEVLDLHDCLKILANV